MDSVRMHKHRLFPRLLGTQAVLRFVPRVWMAETVLESVRPDLSDVLSIVCRIESWEYFLQMGAVSFGER